MKLLDRLYARGEAAFAVVWIVVYVVFMSAFDALSLEAGVAKCLTLPMQLVLIGVLCLWVRHAGLARRFGLRAPVTPAARMLFYVPLVVMLAYKFAFGVTMSYAPLETVLFVFSMFCVGFLEELIFRALLFRGMSKGNPTSAVIVSSLTFGLGHIVNLVNASGQDQFETAVQVVAAIIIGFVLVYVFMRSGSLWPCIVFHGLFNALSAFTDDAAIIAVTGSQLGEALLILGIIAVAGGAYLLYLRKMPSVLEESANGVA